MVLEQPRSWRQRATFGRVRLGDPTNDVVPTAPARSPRGIGSASPGGWRSRDTGVDALRLALLPAILEAAPADDPAPTLDVVLVDGERVNVDLAFGSAGAAPGVGTIDGAAGEAVVPAAADQPGNDMVADADWLVADPDPFIA